MTAEEKYKRLRDGTTRKYVYYGCTRGKDRQCKNKYIRENKLIKQLIKLIDTIKINELGMQQKLEQELKRFGRFQDAIGVEKKESTAHEVNIREYAKYLLKEGSIVEKRELLANLRSKIVYVDKKLELNENQERLDCHGCGV